MAVHKVLLYYGFAPVADPAAVRLWQRTLCESLGIKGRILISKHGINGTVGGELDALKTYAKRTKEYPGFKEIDFKWSEGSGKEFSKLKVKARKELVAFTIPDEIEVDENGVIGGGVHLAPEEVNALVAERGDDVVFFDGRNAWEARIGKFKNAVVPDVVTSRDFVEEVESGKYDHLKDKPVVTYCTGGIRCEILSAVMINRGFKEVYQIKGGIVRYGEKYKDSSLWEGSLYTFDGRMKVNFSPYTKTIGECDSCQGPTSDFQNCSHPECVQLTLLCEHCQDYNTPEHCQHDRSRQHDLEQVG